MDKKFFIPIVAVSVGLGFASRKVKAVDRIAQPSIAVAARIAQISPQTPFLERRPAHYRGIPGIRGIQGFRGIEHARDDRFIRDFAAPRLAGHAYPELSRLSMDFRSASAEDVLPLYAPGQDPITLTKAARDANGTQLGALYISSSGLTLSLF